MSRAAFLALGVATTNVEAAPVAHSTPFLASFPVHHWPCLCSLVSSRVLVAFVEPHTTKTVTRGVLSTILFHSLASSYISYRGCPINRTNIVTSRTVVTKVDDTLFARLIEAIPDLVPLVILPLQEVASQYLHYLPLPTNITGITNSAMDCQLYQFGLWFGRDNYRMMQYDLDEHGNVYRDAEPLETDEVLTIVHDCIYPNDRRIEVMLPLSFRVGQAMGFLSALHVVQQEQAYEGLVILSALVAPLLLQGAAAPTSKRLK